jgi:(1->4)-alpha-D-glucan 1-alpha-D-glucosylmutase
MTSTATHDSKRSEDVRARLAVLSETPEEWTASIERWWQHTAAWRGPLVDPAIGSIILQTLVGAHPLPLDRASEYVRKAMREAKEHTSWTAPDPRYESQVEDFVAGVLADPDLSAELTALSAEIEEAAQVNALTQVTLRLTLPGFPDTYQGTELWDDSLVDPDNRRPVDFDRRRRMLDHAREMDAASAWREERRSGLPKLLLIDKLLHLRAERPRSFGPGGVYEPLEVADDRAIAFVRGGDVAVVVPRLSLRGQSPARVALPRGEWRDLLSDFPVAVLERA